MKLPSLSFGRKKRSFIRKMKHVQRDWALALYVFFATSILVVGLSVYAFLNVNDLKAYVSPSAGSAKSFIDETQLQKTIDAYKQKEVRFEQLKQTLPTAPAISSSASAN